MTSNLRARREESGREVIRGERKRQRSGGVEKDGSEPLVVDQDVSCIQAGCSASSSVGVSDEGTTMAASGESGTEYGVCKLSNAVGVGGGWIAEAD